MRTSRTDIEIDLDRSGPVSYLCDEWNHQRCSGLVAVGFIRWGDPVAVLCGCQVSPSCGCRERVRASLAAVPRST